MTERNREPPGMRALMERVQSEFSRVVAALEKQLQVVEQHNQLLVAEVALLREDVALAQQEARELREQHAMRDEDRTLETQHAATANDNDANANDALTLALEQERSQWASERHALTDEMQRVTQQLRRASASLNEEQTRNVHMSQELQMLQYRVDAAGKAARSMEARLEQVTRLHAEEKTQRDAQFQRLQRLVEDKQEQAQYLADALLERRGSNHEHKSKSTRKKTRQREPRYEEAECSEQEEQVPRDVRGGRRSVGEPERHAQPTTQLGKPRIAHPTQRGAPTNKRGATEDLFSHAATSPTSSSPDFTPPSTPTQRRQDPLPAVREGRSSTAAVATETAIVESHGDHHRGRSSRRSRAAGATIETATDRERGSARSERMQRELSGLRRKLAACMELESI